MSLLVTFGRNNIVPAVLSAALLVSLLPGTARAQQETPPPPATPRTVQLPKPSERTLANGLRVVVVERHQIPLVSAQLLVKNGGEIDPPKLAGLANMTAGLLTEGTETRPAPEIAEAIEALGGTLDSGARWDSSFVSVNVRASQFDPAMNILADVVRRPAFKQEEIERVRQQTLDDLQVALRQPGRLASFVAPRVIFGNSPYGHPLIGTPESLPRVKREDIVRLHQTYYRPNNSVLVIGGDIQPDAAFQTAQRLFGDWPGTGEQSNVASAAAAKDSPAPQSGPRVVVIDKPDAGQAAVVVARTGLRRTDPDFFRGLVANSVLGGGYSARLNQEIRIKRGLSYGAGSTLDARRDVGPFIASTQTKNESGAEVAWLLVSELARLAAEDIKETELVPRKAVLTGGFGRSLETTGGLVAQVGQLALYGLPLDEINRYINNVQAVTPGDIRRFADARLGTRDATVVIVGDASKFLSDLRKRFPHVEVVPEAELDLNGATLRRSGATTSKS